MARGSRGKEILAQIRRWRGEERWLNDRERWRERRVGGGVAGDWPPQHFRCMSEALRLNQIFTCLPPTALPPNYLSLPSVPLFLSLFLSLAVSISHPLPPAPMDNRVILLSCNWEPESACLRRGVWGLCGSLMGITPEDKSWLKCPHCSCT